MNKQAEEEALLLALKEDEAQEEAYRMAALTEIQKHMGVIKSVITRNWRQPLDIPTKGLSCTVVVKVLATGEVVDVRVTKGSGNLAFDRSTELAVRKSSPLPLPTSSAARAAFQEFEFGFYPEGV
jgi:colicin import membrane protein